MDGSSPKLLMIFVKNPVKGKVKTRLAQTIGERKALKVYHRLLSVTRTITTPLQCCRQVWYSDYIEKQDLWEEGDFEKRLQRGNDLGERMEKAFKQAFSEGFEKVVIIGSDCAELTGDIIEEAFKSLDESEVVIGPSEDGGYYLLGMRSFCGDLFADIEWGTPTVYKHTINRIKERNLSLYLLPTLNDIDTEEDLIQSAENFGLL